MSTSRMIGQARIHNGLYQIQCAAKENFVLSMQTENLFEHINNIDVWHCRLGHPSSKVLECLSKKYDDIHFDKNNVCISCHLAKQHRLPFPLSNSICKEPFDIIHVDIWDPFSVQSIHGHKYFLTVVDDFTRFTWIHLMKNKSETRNLLISFVAFVQNQFSRNIKVIRSDNGQEFHWKEFYDKHGIIHQTTWIETPQQNSVVERKYQHILNVTRSLIFQSKIPKVFWNYAISHSVYLINRLPSSVIQNKSPYEMLYKTVPNFQNLRIFGCICFASTIENNRNKLDPRAKKCIFLGLKNGTKGYVVIDTNTREIFVSRNVVCHEHIFCKILDNDLQKNIESDQSYFNHMLDNDYVRNNEAALNVETITEIAEYPEVADLDLRRSTRTRRMPPYLENYHHQLTSSSQKKVRYPLNSVLSYKRLSEAQLNYTLSLSLCKMNRGHMRKL